MKAVFILLQYVIIKQSQKVLQQEALRTYNFEQTQNFQLQVSQIWPEIMQQKC